MPMKSATGHDVPVYGERDVPAGLYLGLFHGRDAVGQDLDNWGYNGPLIGPLCYLHVTYGYDVKFEFVSAADAARFYSATDIDSGVSQQIGLVEGLLPYDGKYYGDFSVAYYPLPGHPA